MDWRDHWKRGSRRHHNLLHLCDRGRQSVRNSAMKRCPTCKREFEDSITYCLDDGSPLVSQSPPDSDETLVSPSIRGRDIPTTQYGQLGGKATVSGSIADLPVIAGVRRGVREASRVAVGRCRARDPVSFRNCDRGGRLRFPRSSTGQIRIAPWRQNRRRSSVPDTQTPSESSSATGAPTDEKVVCHS